MASQSNGHLSPTTTTASPCPHLSAFRSQNGSHPFLALQPALRLKPHHGGAASILRDPHELPRCAACLSPSSPRLFACLSCATISCHSHAACHAAALGHTHELAIDVDRAELFCCVCHDQIYDPDFDAAVVLSQSCFADNHKHPPLHPENVRKRRRVDYRPWVPDQREWALVGRSASVLESKDSSLPWGLRGLNNLGNTCFMNSVLQALLHTPPLRNYFLSDKHNRYYCQQKDMSVASATRSGRNVTGKGDVRVCLACDVDAMFSAIFSGDHNPYSPAKFLYSWWQHAANLASYEQQDAHEFFISMLDGLHEKLGSDPRKPHCQGSGDCCIAHKVFSGILRSDVMCMACGFTSTTYDPCVDISLDLEPNQGGSAKTKSKSQQVRNGETECKNLSKNCGVATLMGCLDHFTRPEKLGSDQKFFCQQCQVRQESLKQMSIRKLPLVSCFHIKRFEHSTIRKMSRKVDRYLQFPFSLNMAPYLSSSIMRSRYGNRMFPFDGDESDDASSGLSSEFELFAVVTHSGKLDAGHYVTYLRLSNHWYKCDDAWITEVNENIVRAAQGYMMFYVQKMLYYKAGDKQAS